MMTGISVEVSVDFPDVMPPPDIGFAWIIIPIVINMYRYFYQGVLQRIFRKTFLSLATQPPHETSLTS